MPVVWTPEAGLARIRQGALRGIFMGANIVRNEVLRLIQQTPKTGREYRRRGVTHTASAPGEAPASDTGALVREVRVSVDEAKLTATVNSGAAYAAALEFGTPTMQPRPYMRVALQNTRERVVQVVNEEIRKALEANGG